jgi:prepilin-type N-terminal cleavage/methylation domain-containing protein
MKKYFQWSLKIISRILSGEQGMTLVETLVAIAILGVSVAAFILALSAGSIAVRMQEEDAQAQGLARSQMETIKAAAYDSTGASYSTISAPAGYSLSLSTNSALYSNSNIQKISVTVLHNGASVYALEGYKVDR